MFNHIKSKIKQIESRLSCEDLPYPALIFTRGSQSESTLQTGEKIKGSFSEVVQRLEAKIKKPLRIINFIRPVTEKGRL